MRIAVLSDIHGNFEAFARVLDHLAPRGVDRILSLGDNIGYGPDPEAVVNLLQEREIPSVMGNHELALESEQQLEWFNQDARSSLLWTRRNLSAVSRNFLAGLPVFRVEHGCRFVHGFPPDSITLYLFQISDLEMIRTLEQMKEWIVFTGHTHCLQLVSPSNGMTRRCDLNPGSLRLDPDRRYIVNAGSVGQPRDGDRRAKYLIMDTGTATLEVHAVPYDVPMVAKRIQAAGLPQRHADRLY